MRQIQFPPPHTMAVRVQTSSTPPTHLLLLQALLPFEVEEAKHVDPLRKQSALIAMPVPRACVGGHSPFLELSEPLMATTNIFNFAFTCGLQGNAKEYL